MPHQHAFAEASTWTWHYRHHLHAKFCGRLSVSYGTQTSHSDETYLKNFLHYCCEVFDLTLETLLWLNQLPCKRQRFVHQDRVSGQIEVLGKDRMEDNNWYLCNNWYQPLARAATYVERTNVQCHTSPLKCPWADRLGYAPISSIWLCMQTAPLKLCNWGKQDLWDGNECLQTRWPQRNPAQKFNAFSKYSFQKAAQNLWSGLCMPIVSWNALLALQL